MRFKKLSLAKQGLSKLKAKKVKKDFNQKDVETTYILIVDSLDNLAYLTLVMGL